MEGDHKVALSRDDGKESRNWLSSGPFRDKAFALRVETGKNALALVL